MTLLRWFYSKMIETGFAIAILLLCVVFYLSYSRTVALSDTSRLMDRTRLIRIEQEQIVSYLTDSDATFRWYLLSGDTLYMQAGPGIKENIQDGLSKLENVLSGDEFQEQNIQTIRDLMTERFLFLEQAVEHPGKTDPTIKKINMLKSNAQLSVIRSKMREMYDYEMQLLRASEVNRDHFIAATPVFTFLLFLIALMILVVSYIKIKDELRYSSRQLAINAENTKRINDLNVSLEVKNLELQRINAEMSAFSYIASHDLQEPLRKINAFADRIIRLEQEQLSTAGKDYLNRMRSAVDRMRQLIEDLLTYSRTSNPDDEFEMTDLNGILQEARHELSEFIREHKAVIEPDLLPHAKVLPFQFRQLFVNLIGNAVKYHKPGIEPHIRITAETVRDAPEKPRGVTGSNFLKISVADNGIGFEQEYSERIFEVFQRLHGRSEFAGTGIGLAICKKIIQNHQGSILAEGHPGEGAVFRIYLPLEGGN